MALVSDTTRSRRSNPRTVSGRFVLRLPPTLHAELRERARQAALSLNEYCVRSLSPPRNRLDRDDVSAAMEHAAAIAGASLLGVIAFGSWARGQATETSDVDLLIVVERGFDLTRATYVRWDERPLTIDGRPVDAHFVRLPAGTSGLSGLWAETAIDGIVLFERGLVVSSWLAEVRRALVEGRLARRLVHGQPYWCEVA
jgi:predicted nucleotidyltransferase